MRPLLCPFLAASISLALACKAEAPPPPPDPECGNGLLEAGETCEGMPTPEGCDPNACTVRPGWACTPEPPSDGETGGPVEPMEWTSTCEELETCGDGVIDPEEDCDDANAMVGDGCSGCRIDPQWVCVGQPSECHACGDGFRNAEEQCDDGEMLDMGSAGCVNCMIVPGWECFPGQSADLCGPVCGDGMWFDTSIPGVTIGFAEGCDDGNLVDGDGCDSSCNVEDGYECEAVAPATSMCMIPEETTGTDTDTDTDGSSGTDSGSTDTGTTGGSTGGTTGGSGTGSTG
jgi:cysteine-rich repeat protein